VLEKEEKFFRTKNSHVMSLVSLVSNQIKLVSEMTFGLVEIWRMDRSTFQNCDLRFCYLTSKIQEKMQKNNNPLSLGDLLEGA